MRSHHLSLSVSISHIEKKISRDRKPTISSFTGSYLTDISLSLYVSTSDVTSLKRFYNDTNTHTHIPTAARFRSQVNDDDDSFLLPGMPEPSDPKDGDGDVFTYAKIT